jgi:hypothetical protein
MEYDTHITTLYPQRKMIRLISAIHLQEESNGDALVVDDRTLTAARVNKAAYVILQALHQPRTQEDLITILADAASCDARDAATPVSQLIDELKKFDWIEFI